MNAPKAIIMLICLSFFLTPAVWAAEGRYVRIAAGDIASGLFAEAGQLATYLGQTNSPSCPPRSACGNLSVTAQASASARAALLAVRAGVVEAALVPSEQAYDAFSGDDHRTWQQLRTLARIEVEPLIVLTRPDLRYAGLASLSGQRVVTGARGTDSAGRVGTLLAALGLSSRDYRQISAEGLERMTAVVTSGNADALVVLGQELDAATLALLANGQLKLLVPGKAEVDHALMGNPYLQTTRIRLGGSNAVPTVATSTVLVVRADLPAVDVTALMAHLWPGEGKELPLLQLGTASGVSPAQAVQNLPVPLHSAAEAFYRTHGVLNEDDQDGSSKN